MNFALILVAFLINFINPLLLKADQEINLSSSKLKKISYENTLNKKKSEIPVIHIVKVGDTISNISKLYSIEKTLIIKLNNLQDENQIYVGQNLLISNNKNLYKQTALENKEGNAIHIVQRGENLTEISNKYNLNLEDLVEINGLKNRNSIKVGMKLLLQKGNLNQTRNSGSLKDNNILSIEKKTYGPLTIQNKFLRNHIGQNFKCVIKIIKSSSSR